MYCVLHTSTFTVSQKTQNNVHPPVSAMQYNLVLPHPMMSVFTSQLPAFSPDVCAAWCRHQVPRYLLSYTDIYISRYLHIYRYLHDVYITRSPISYWGLEVDMWWQWRRPLQVCSLDLVIYCHVFTNPSRAELGGDKYWQIAHYFYI